MFWTKFFLPESVTMIQKVLISINFSSIFNAQCKELFFSFRRWRFVSAVIADEINSFGPERKENEKYVFTWHFFCEYAQHFQ